MNTPHTQDFEKKTINLLQEYALALGCTEYLTRPDVQRETVEKFAAAHTEALQAARIDELEKAGFAPDSTGKYWYVDIGADAVEKHYKERIKELES